MNFFYADGCIILSQILSEHRSITSYLQKFHPDEDGPFGITVQCLETFIKSCAGYSVITYILGVGDRFVCLLASGFTYLYFFPGKCRRTALHCIKKKVGQEPITTHHTHTLIKYLSEGLVIHIVVCPTFGALLFICLCVQIFVFFNRWNLFFVLTSFSLIYGIWFGIKILQLNQVFIIIAHCFKQFKYTLIIFIWKFVHGQKISQITVH